MANVLFCFVFFRVAAKTGDRSEADVRLGRPSVQFELGGAQRVVDIVAFVSGDGRAGRSFGDVVEPVGAAVAVECGR